MRYSPETEQMIVEQIEREPEREVILPDWAYWEGSDTPWVYIEGMPRRLVVVLYERLIRGLPEGAGLARKPGTHPRNINPFLYQVMPSPHVRATCANDHVYTTEDYIEGVGYRCQTCRAAKLLGTDSPVDLNRKKTKCPKGHALVLRKNGRRRCLECPRAQQAAYAARKKGTS
jgi:hypothetical protein